MPLRQGRRERVSRALGHTARRRGAGREHAACGCRQGAYLSVTGAACFASLRVVWLQPPTRRAHASPLGTEDRAMSAIKAITALVLGLVIAIVVSVLAQGVGRQGFPLHECAFLDEKI